MKTAFRWALIVLLVCAGLWLLNAAVYNYWAAGGPPTPNPEMFEAGGNLMLSLSAVSFLAAIGTLVRTCRRRRAR